MAQQAVSIGSETDQSLFSTYKTFWQLCPDSKTQVMMEYVQKTGGSVVPGTVRTVVISMRHATW